MNGMLIKVLSVGLTVSQIFTRPAGPTQVQTNFQFSTDAEKAQTSAQIHVLLHDGCQYALKAFKADNLPLEALLQMLPGATATLSAAAPAKASDADDPNSAPQDDDPSSAPQDVKIEAPKVGASAPAPKLPGGVQGSMPTTNDLLAIYQEFCLGDAKGAPLDLGPVVADYNESLKDLPDVKPLIGLRLPEAATVLDGHGNKFSEIYEGPNRRHWVAIDTLPAYVPQAFVSSEDQHFYEHQGVDIHGIARAYQKIASSSKAEGGSTITQQVIKNRIVGDKPNFTRKIQEMVLAAQYESMADKKTILEMYINGVYEGWASWGIEMAAQSYFNKAARRLTIAEAAFLAGMVQGPGVYNPTTHLEEANKRRNYVLVRMHDDKAITDAQYAEAMANPTTPAQAFVKPSQKSAFYFMDEIQRDARRNAGIPSLNARAYVINSTIHPDLQRETEEAVQDGLANYESTARLAGNKAVWEGPLGNMADDIAKRKSTWQALLPVAHPRSYDVHWPLATVTVKSSAKGGNRAGLVDGREMKLVGPANVLATLKAFDLIYVHVDEKKNVATLLIPPHVQGAALVLEAATGRVLSLTGGFSFGLSQFDRAGVAGLGRQVGSTIKPFADMTALNAGFQPNTLIPDVPLNIAPLELGGSTFSPKNNDGVSGGLISMRVSIEQSLNIPTVQLACRTFGTCEAGLDHVLPTLADFVYPRPMRQYSVLLGAQESHLLTMAAAYATFANVASVRNSGCPLCLKPTPHFFDSIELEGKSVWNRGADTLAPVRSVDRVSLFQMRRILEGSPARGTSGKLIAYAGYLGCKTGTTNHNRDAWLICFTNDLVVATWVGYDKARFLGPNDTGASVALPIAERILRKTFEVYAKPQPLKPAPADVAAQIQEFALPDFGFEAVRLNKNGPIDTSVALLSPQERTLGIAVGDDVPDNDAIEEDNGQNDGGSQENVSDANRSRPPADDDFQSWKNEGQGRNRVDPDYLRLRFFR